MNACLWDAALNLSLSSLPVACICFSLCLFVDLFPPRSAPLIWQDKVGRAGALQDSGDAAAGNKSVIFHLVHKQVVMLRWAIAYYGLRPACDISKHRRTDLCERQGWTNEECVLTSRRGLLGVWISSSHANPGRQWTCYAWAWEQTRVQHLSSCLVRHKLWIMNIAEVMGLWDSFMTPTNTISHESWGGRTRQPYARLFCFAKQAAELFNSAAWLLGHLCLTHAVVANVHLSLDAVSQHADSDRGREAAGMWGKVSDVTQMTVWGLWNTSPALFRHNLPFLAWADKNQSPPQWSCSPDKSPQPALWTGMQIFFVIMQVAGFKRKEGWREQEEWRWRANTPLYACRSCPPLSFVT